MSGYETKIEYPTSLTFAATWRRYRAHQPPESGRPPRERRVALGEFNGQGLVQAGADIQVRDTVSLEITTFGPHQPVQPRVVAAIDKDTRAATGEWVINWAGVPVQRAGRRRSSVVLDPERFTETMLVWAYESTGEGQSGALLTGFAPDDISFESSIPLADDLQEKGLLLRTTGPHATIRLTAHGIAAAQKALHEHSDRSLRIKTLRNRVVLWIDTASETQTYLDLRDFLHSPDAAFGGTFFTEAELQEEAAYLCEKGILRNDDLPWCMYPVLTALGRDCAIEHGGNVHESTNPKPPQNNTIINFGNNNQNSTGDGAQTSYAPVPAPREPAAEPATATSPTGTAPAEPARHPKLARLLTRTNITITLQCTIVIAVYAVLTYYKP